MGEKVYINICYISSLHISKTGGIQPSEVIVNPRQKRKGHDTSSPKKVLPFASFPQVYFLRFCVLTFPHGDMGIKDISLPFTGPPNGEENCVESRLKKKPTKFDLVKFAQCPETSNKT